MRWVQMEHEEQEYYEANKSQGIFFSFIREWSLLVIANEEVCTQIPVWYIIETGGKNTASDLPRLSNLMFGEEWDFSEK